MIDGRMALSALFVEQQLIKEAAAGDITAREVLSGGAKALKGGWDVISGAARSAGKGAHQALASSGHPHIGRAAGAGLALLPAAALTYLGYKALKPEVHSVGRRAAGAVRSKLQDFEARSYATSPYYTGGRYV